MNDQELSFSTQDTQCFDNIVDVTCNFMYLYISLSTTLQFGDKLHF